MRRIRWAKRLFATVVCLLALYCGLGYFAVPYLLRHTLPNHITRTTGHELTIGEAAFDPWQGRLQLGALAWRDREGVIFLSGERLFVEIAFWPSLREKTLIVEQLNLSEPFVRLERDRAGALNLMRLLPQSELSSPPTDPPRALPWRLEQARIDAGKVLYRQARGDRPATQEILDDFTVTLSQLDFTGSNPAQLTLTLTSQNAQLTSTAALGLAPLRIEGELAVTGIDLPRLTPWLGASSPLQSVSGRAALQTAYRFTHAADPQIAWQLSLPAAQLTLSDLDLHTNTAETWRLQAKTVTWRDLAVTLQENATGTIAWQLRRAPFEINDVAVTDTTHHVTAARIGWNEVDVSGYVDTQNALAVTLVSLPLRVQRLEVAGLGQALVRAQTLSLQGTRAALQRTSDAQPSRWQVSAKRWQCEECALTARDTAQQPAIRLKQAALQDWRVDGATRNIQAAQLAVTAAQINLALLPENRLDLLTLFEPHNARPPAPRAPELTPNTPPSPTPPASATTPTNLDEDGWHLTLDQLTLRESSVLFADRSRRPVVTQRIEAIDLTIKDYPNTSDHPITWSLSAKVNDKGTLSSTGRATLDPLDAEFNAISQELALKPLQAYLNDYLNLELIDGVLDSNTTWRVSQAREAAPTWRITGEAVLARLITRDRKLRKDLIKWERLALRGATFERDATRQRLAIREVAVDRPYARVTINPDRSFNMHDITHTTSAAAPPSNKIPTTASKSSQPSGTTQASQDTALFHFDIGRIDIHHGYTDFSDYSLILPFIAQIDQLNGNIEHLSSETSSQADFHLHGKVHDIAPVEIQGTIQPTTGDSSVTLSFRNMPLPTMTPYMAEFAGYKIEKGQMSLDLQYQIRDRQLEASNKLLIDQFTLGERVENPKAVDLPLRLAIALLKDRHGKIDIDVPIRGSLDDPQFSVTALVFDALGNLLSKIVTSPFRWLASLADSPQDLSHIAFAAGNAELSETERQKLAQLGQAMQDRPALKLDIRGIASLRDDWPAMTDRALLEQLKIRRSDELKQQGTWLRPEYIELREADYQRLLAEAFIEKFPNLAHYSLFGEPELRQPEQGEFYTVARETMMAAIPPDRDKLRDLASQRAHTIARQLLQDGLTHQRLFILDSRVIDDDAPGLQAELELHD